MRKTLILVALLAGCGGGGGGSDPIPATTDSPTPASPTSPSNPTNPTAPSTPSSPAQPDPPTTPHDTLPSPPPNSPFTAFLTSAEPAPADGATITGTVPLVIHGTSIANAELLPEDGYEPKLAILNVEQDHTKASTSFDTRRFPNGTLVVRLVAFDGQIGQPSSQIVAMPTRTWQINNNPAPRWVALPPATVMPEIYVREEDLPYVDPAPINVWLSLSAAEFENQMVNDWGRFASMYRTYIPEHVRLYADSHGQVIGQSACINGIISPSFPASDKAIYCRTRLERIRDLMNAVPH